MMGLEAKLQRHDKRSRQSWKQVVDSEARALVLAGMRCY